MAAASAWGEGRLRPRRSQRRGGAAVVAVRRLGDNGVGGDDDDDDGSRSSDGSRRSDDGSSTTRCSYASRSCLAAASRVPKAAVLAAGALLRAALVCYGAWHDGVYPSLPYTDIDYAVFTRGAEHVRAGRSPYLCDTYRYPPVLAALLVPGLAWQLPSAGKAVFCLADLAAADLVWRVVERDHGVNTGWPAACAAAWLLNPLTAAVSTRGNAEGLVAVAVLAALWALRERRHATAGVAYGLAVHLKLYPVIYALPTALHLSPTLCGAVDAKLGWGQRPAQRRAAPSRRRLLVSSSVGWVRAAATPALTRFALGALVSFFAAFAASYAACGREFVWHTYLYHVSRADHRHNFSPYFYPLYLALGGGEPQGPDTAARWLGLAALVPQAALTALAGVALSGDLAAAWLVQTMAFVAFNKVCTSQYFVWVLCLLPAAAPRLGLELGEAAGLAAVWAAGQGAWLQAAYRLESAGEGNYAEVWACGLALLGCHAYCVAAVARACVRSARP